MIYVASLYTATANRATQLGLRVPRPSASQPYTIRLSPQNSNIRRFVYIIIRPDTRKRYILNKFR